MPLRCNSFLSTHANQYWYSSAIIQLFVEALTLTHPAICWGSHITQSHATCILVVTLRCIHITCLLWATSSNNSGHAIEYYCWPGSGSRGVASRPPLNHSEEPHPPGLLIFSAVIVEVYYKVCVAKKKNSSYFWWQCYNISSISISGCGVGYNTAPGLLLWAVEPWTLLC
jgi:hypothetical protein